MLTLNTSITYPLLLIKSTTKRSFEGLGRIIKKSGDTAKRLLMPAAMNMIIIEQIAQNIFAEETALTLSIDDTLVSKIYSKIMHGAGRFFDNKLGKKITSYRLMVGALTNGKNTIPIGHDVIFDKDLLTEGQTVATKLDVIKIFLARAQKLFPNTKIKIAMDGAFATIEILTWALANKVELDVRMHKNRKVTLKNGKVCKIADIPKITPRGRQMARTVIAEWHGLQLYITAERRIDKHGSESVVFIASTYEARPRQYLDAYLLRWPIEKFFRTSKQHLGLQECFSTKLKTQQDHFSSVMLAYSIAQLEMNNQRFDTPEKAIRQLKLKNTHHLIDRFARLDRIFGDVYA